MTKLQSLPFTMPSFVTVFKHGIETSLVVVYQPRATTVPCRHRILPLRKCTRPLTHRKLQIYSKKSRHIVLFESRGGQLVMECPESPTRREITSPHADMSRAKVYISRVCLHCALCQPPGPLHAIECLTVVTNMDIRTYMKPVSIKN